MRKKNIPAGAGHFLSTEIDSIDFKTENLTTEIRTNNAEKQHFLKKIFQNRLETDETIK